MMRRRDMIVASGAALFGSVLPQISAGVEIKQPQRVLYFTRNVGYYHSVVTRQDGALSHSERAFVAMGKRLGIEVECTKDGRLFDGDLSHYDAFACYTNNDLTLPNPENEPPMSKEGKQRLLDAIADGKGFIGFHSSCACWRTPEKQGGSDTQDVKNREVDPYLAMLGGEFVAHGPQQEATMRIVSEHFPGMQGLGKSFRMREEWYALKNFAKDLHVILVQETAGMRGPCYQRPPFPSTWARRHGKGRVFFTSMGHREDTWVQEPFQQIVLGGLSWATRQVEANILPNIEEVTPHANRLWNTL